VLPIPPLVGGEPVERRSEALGAGLGSFGLGHPHNVFPATTRAESSEGARSCCIGFQRSDEVRRRARCWPLELGITRVGLRARCGLQRVRRNRIAHGCVVAATVAAGDKDRLRNGLLVRSTRVLPNQEKIRLVTRRMPSNGRALPPREHGRPSGDKQPTKHSAPRQRLAEEHRGEDKDEHDTQLVHGRNFARRPELECTKIAQPR
jgi:hypothetical protein